MSEPVKRTRPVEAMQNTDEAREALVAWLQTNGIEAEVRTERPIAGTVSWWDGDHGYHVDPDAWVVIDVPGTGPRDAVIYSPDEFSAAFPAPVTTSVPERVRALIASAVKLRADGEPDGDPLRGLAGRTFEFEGLKVRIVHAAHNGDGTAEVLVDYPVESTFTIDDPSPERVQASRAFSGIIR